MRGSDTDPAPPLTWGDSRRPDPQDNNGQSQSEDAGARLHSKILEGLTGGVRPGTATGFPAWALSDHGSDISGGNMHRPTSAARVHHQRDFPGTSAEDYPPNMHQQRALAAVEDRWDDGDSFERPIPSQKGGHQQLGSVNRSGWEAGHTHVTPPQSAAGRAMESFEDNGQESQVGNI